MRLLVVGASGHLGGEICRQARESGHDVTGAFQRAPAPLDGVAWHRVDVRDPVAVERLVDRVGPTAVVNAAYSYQDWASCADGGGNVAAAAARHGARLVHISSDVVHSGRDEPYPDDEPPSPIFPYGAAKAAGETAVRLAHPAAVIVRTSLILGGPASKQDRLCLDLMAGRVPGALFSDEVRCPIGVADLAAAVLELSSSTVAGLINVAGPQALTRLELGRLIAARHGLDPAALPVCTVAESGLVRPRSLRLDTARAAWMLRTRLRGAAEYLVS